MNGVHDMGGMHGMGPVEIEKDEPVFHAEWEARTYALTIACGSHRKWNIDVSRHSRERMPPADYLAATYYERWLFGLRTLLVEQGLVTARELETGRAEGQADPAGVLRAHQVEDFLANRIRARVDVEAAPRFQAGAERRRAQHPSVRAHAAAALRARAARRDRPRLRGIHLSRHQRDDPRQEAAASVRRAFRRARAVGTRRLRARQRVRESLG